MTIDNTPALTRGGKTSRWSAAFNPVQFTFKMSDGDKSTRKNQRFVVEITSGSKSIQATFYADMDERAVCDISAFLQTLVSAVDNYNHANHYHFDSDLFAVYTLRVKEQWDNVSDGTLVNGAWQSVSDTYYVIYTAMQIGDFGGGNMIDYVCFDGGSSAEYLTCFKSPMSYNGLPSDMALIIDESLSDKDLYIRFTSTDVNGSVLENALYLTYLLNETGGYLLQENGDRIALESAIDGRTEVSKGYGVLRFRIPDVLKDVRYIKVEVYYLSGADEIKVAKDKMVNTIIPCSDPFVYLKWINGHGAWDYFRFGYNQVMGGEVENTVIASRNIGSWETSRGSLFVAQKTAARKIDLFAGGLNRDQAEAINSLSFSPKVEMLISSDPERWISAIVSDGSLNAYNTRSGQSNVKITISLPGVNIQRQ